MHVCWNAAAPFKLNRHGEGISLKEFARIYIVSNPELISARKPVRVVNDMARRDKVAIGTTICIVNGDVESGTAGPRIRRFAVIAREEKHGRSLELRVYDSRVASDVHQKP